MLSLILAASASTCRIVFVGNSLLNNNDVPGTIAKLLESDGSGRKVVHQANFVPHLENVPVGSPVARAVADPRLDFVVLQSAMVSSSRTRKYPQTRGIALAKAAKRQGSRVILYVEWPRRGEDETEYTLDVYRRIAKASGAEILPVAYAWNHVLRTQPNAPLWVADGNHATPEGSFIAAACVYFRIAGTSRAPIYRPTVVSAAFANRALTAARAIERKAPARKAEQ